MKTDLDLYKEAMDNVPPDSLEFADLSFAIIDRVHGIMERTPGMTQKKLAAKLGKKESEISRWLGGMHNLTLRNLARLNVALGSKVIVVPPADAHNTAFIYTPSCTARASNPYAVKGADLHHHLVTTSEEIARSNDPFTVKATAAHQYLATSLAEPAKAA
jgi:transcriptional regulator with XRE-family HTH domain